MIQNDRVDSPGAHPRACGENSLTCIVCGKPLGSPPRLRGKLLAYRGCRRRLRLTPAPAGKTRKRFPKSCSRQAHPRACGENVAEYMSQTISIGSPPRLRGKLEEALDGVSVGGLTPAPAGKTLPARALARRARAHPRACGENKAPISRRSTYPGSPPRLRGKPASQPIHA